MPVGIDERLYIFNEFFVNRFDTFAVQTSGGPYTRVGRAITTEDLRNHFEGKTTVGLYQLDQENKLKWMVFDVDPEHVENPKETTERILQACLDKKRFYKDAVLLEASRYPDHSYHIWGLFKPKIAAKVAKWLGDQILSFAGSDPRAIELFPKQTKLTESRPYGNLVKAPLGLHQKEKKWSRFLDLETFDPLPNEALREAWGCNFSEKDLATIISLSEEKRGVQTKIVYDSLAKAKPLKGEEEQRIVHLLSKYWREGYRNQLCMAALGFFIKKGVPQETAYRIVDSVTSITDDEEKRARLELVKFHYERRKEMVSELKGSTGIQEVIKKVMKNGSGK